MTQICGMGNSDPKVQREHGQISLPVVTKRVDHQNTLSSCLNFIKEGKECVTVLTLGVLFSSMQQFSLVRNQDLIYQKFHMLSSASTWIFF